jgi:hypothetical protein
VTTGTDNPLLLTGGDLDDAREVATWAVLDHAESWRQNLPDGNGISLTDPVPRLVDAVDLTITLRSTALFSFHRMQWPLTPAGLAVLRREAENILEWIDYQDGSWTDPGLVERWAGIANRVLVTCGRLESELRRSS